MKSGAHEFEGIYIAWCYTEVRATPNPIGSCNLSCDIDDKCLQTMSGAACQIALTPLRVMVCLCLKSPMTCHLLSIATIYTFIVGVTVDMARLGCHNLPKLVKIMYTKLLGVRGTRSCIRLHAMGVLAFVCVWVYGCVCPSSHG